MKPTVKTNEVKDEDVTSTTASVSGNVTDDGGAQVTERGVCWSTNHNPTVSDSFVPKEGDLGEYTCDLTNLSANTKYYACAYAKNSKGITYGNEVNFETKPLQTYTIDVSANPDNGGVVMGGGTFDEGQSCTVKAIDNTGYNFLNWTENDEQVSTQREYTFDVMGNRNLVANFTAQPFTIIATPIPEDGGIISGTGGYNFDDQCTLVATPNPGYGFEKWTENGNQILADANYTFTVIGNRNLVAHFRVMAFELNVSANPSVIAQGGSSNLNAVASNGNGSFTYRWTPASSLSNSNIQNPIASPMETTTYTCTATSAAGLTENGTCTVTVVCPPTNLTATVQNTNQVRLNWTAPNLPTSYKVYRDNTLIAQNITATTYTDSNVSAGDHSYQVSAVYQGVESLKSNSAQVTVYPSLNVTATANPNTIPNGSSTTLTANATGGNGSYTYSWTPTTGLSNANIQSPTATPTSTTTYTVHVNSNGQTATANVTVNVVKPPTNLTATVQNGNSVYLSWTAANPATKYKVYRDNTLINSNVTTTHYTDNNPSSGTHTYQVSTVYNNVESPKSNTASVTVYPSLNVTATANPSTIPLGNSSSLTANASGGNGSYTYNWTPTTGLNNANIQSPTATPTATTTYTVHVSSNGQTATANVTVNVVKPPTNLTAIVQNLNNIYLTWTAANPATKYKVYRNNTLINSNVTTTHYTDSNLSPGTYNYQVSSVYNNVESPLSSSVQATIAPPPTGAIFGLFSVSATQQVWFSQGNLQYKASTNTWRFATNQWDYVGEDNANISQYYNGWIDLFGWGTSGYNHGAVCYQPWSTSSTNTYYYAYGQSTYHLYNQTGKADWGYNQISNGGNIEDQWRTLTSNEWMFVVDGRTTASGLRFANAIVNNIEGIILLPDDWDSNTYSLNNTNNHHTNFGSNTLTVSQWNILEQAGAVFLPKAGHRNEFSYWSNAPLYWSSTRGSDAGSWCYSFNNGAPVLYNRYYGCSVRLVQDY